jgi:hypothetical protein
MDESIYPRCITQLYALSVWVATFLNHRGTKTDESPTQKLRGLCVSVVILLSLLRCAHGHVLRADDLLPLRAEAEIDK